MRGTGSKTVLVDDAFVPAHLTVSPFADSRIDRPLFRIPPFTIASTGAAPIVVGMAQARDRRDRRDCADEGHRQRATARDAVARTGEHR